MAQRQFGIRLAVEGSDRAERTLKQFGQTGQESLDRVRRASRPASKGLLAVNDATQEVQRGLDGMAQRLGPVGAALSALGPKGAAAGAGVAAVTAGLAAGIRRARQAAQEFAQIREQAGQSGVDPEAFQELTHAAQQYGVAQQTVADGLRELTLRADEFAATGKGPAAAAFDRLGLSRAQVDARVQNVDRFFSSVMERVRGLEDRAAQTRVLDEIFGDEAGQRMAQVLDATQRQWRRNREEARELGIVIRDEIIKNAEAMNQKLKTTETIIDRNLDKTAYNLAPIYREGAEGLAAVTGELRQRIDELQRLTGGTESLGPGALARRAQNLEGQIADKRRLQDEGGFRAFVADNALQRAIDGGLQGDIERLRDERARLEPLLRAVNERSGYPGPRSLGGGAGDANRSGAGDTRDHEADTPAPPPRPENKPRDALAETAAEYRRRRAQIVASHRAVAGETGYPGPRDLDTRAARAAQAQAAAQARANTVGATYPGPRNLDATAGDGGSERRQRGQRELADIRERNRLLRARMRGEEKLVDLMRVRQRLGGPDSKAWRENRHEIERALETTRRLERQLRRQQRIIDGTARAFGNFAGAIVSGSATAGSALDQLAQDVLRVAQQTLVTKPLKEALTSGLEQGLGSLDFGFGSGRLSNTDLSSYDTSVSPPPGVGPAASAQGNVFDRPAMTQVSEHRHPEAVMPLRRLPSGDLGVQAAGRDAKAPAVKIEVVDQRSGGEPVKTQKRKGKDGRDVVRLIVRDQIGRGEFDAAMESRYGLTPQGVPR